MATEPQIITNQSSTINFTHVAQVDILNFGHFDFDIVSDFDISISDFRLPDNSLPNMMIQSKTNSHLSIINKKGGSNHGFQSPNQTSHPDNVGIPQFCTFHFDLSTLTMAAEAQNLSREMILSAYKAALHLSRTLYTCRARSTNRPLFMQNKPNSLKAKINATLFATKNYENKPPRPTPKNKPNSNPIQTQIKPNPGAPGHNTRYAIRNQSPRDTQYAIRNTNPIPPPPNFTAFARNIPPLKRQ